MPVDLTVENRPYAEVLDAANNMFISKHGFHLDPGGGFTDYTTAWSEVSGNTSVDYVAVATTVFVKSSSASDVLAGVGAEKVTLTYLDDQFAIQSVSKDLNGTTLVEMATDFYRFISLQVTQSNNGANDTTNVGQLDIFNAGATENYGKMAPLYNLDGQCTCTIPAGYVGIIHAPGLSQASGEVRQKLLIREDGGVWQLRGQQVIFGSLMNGQIPALTVPAGTDVELQGSDDTAVISYHQLHISLLPTS